MKNFLIMVLIFVLAISAKSFLEVYERASYEYHIELLDQNMIRVSNNYTVVVMHRDSLGNYFINDNE